VTRLPPLSDIFSGLNPQYFIFIEGKIMMKKKIFITKDERRRCKKQQKPMQN
jgi:hypothetical protein